MKCDDCRQSIVPDLGSFSGCKYCIHNREYVNNFTPKEEKKPECFGEEFQCDKRMNCECKYSVECVITYKNKYHPQPFPELPRECSSTYIERATNAVMNCQERGVFFKAGFIIVDTETYLLMQAKEWDINRKDIVKENIVLKKVLAEIKTIIKSKTEGE